MTSAELTHVSTTTTSFGRAPAVADAFRRLFGDIKAWRRLRETRRILSGLDERTLKDIGAPRLAGASADVDAAVLRRLETLC